MAATGYPTPTDPAAPFVEQLVHAISLKGIDVTVIAPQSIVKHWFRHTELHPRHRSYSLEGGANIEVYQPTVLSFGGRFTKLNDYFLKRAIDKTARKLKRKPDLCYGHFWHFAYFLYPYAKRESLPLFIATGEARITLHQRQTTKKLATFVEYVKGVICVSTKNREESICCGGSLGSLSLSYEKRKDITVNSLNNLKAGDPDVIVTACPLCQSTFSKYSDIPVKDIAQILDSSIRER